jgi:glucose dehydrogenase
MPYNSLDFILEGAMAVAVGWAIWRKRSTGLTVYALACLGILPLSKVALPWLGERSLGLIVLFNVGLLVFLIGGIWLFCKPSRPRRRRKSGPTSAKPS